jgi:hypothetical protein
MKTIAPSFGFGVCSAIAFVAVVEHLPRTLFIAISGALITLLRLRAAAKEGQS